MSSPSEVDQNECRREAALAFLFGRIDYERVPPEEYRAREFKLQRMVDLLDRLGNPHRELPIVHVAGTKGKGSTAAMIGAVLTAAGFRTGVFTSPHLERLEERIAIDGQPCRAEELVWLVDRLVPVVEAMDRLVAADEIGPTYFELTTAMALVHFVRREAQAAVLEVGLGGRLDSTNVCVPRVSVITSISLDHTRQLGDTLESIAQEKAGIIKPGVPVVSGVREEGPRDVIRRISAERGCRLIEAGVDFDFTYRAPRSVDSAETTGRIDFHYESPTGRHSYDDVPLKLLGRHQGANAAVALAVLLQLAYEGWEIPDSAVRTGLSEARCPARVEVVARRPVVVVDGAHNPASIEALAGVLDESFSPRRKILVFATTREKDVAGMLSHLVQRFDEVILTRYLNNPRAVPPDELASVVSGLCDRPPQICGDPAEAWRAAISGASADDLICVTGSFFIAAEIRACIDRFPASECPHPPGGESG